MTNPARTDDDRQWWDPTRADRWPNPPQNHDLGEWTEWTNTVMTNYGLTKSDVAHMLAQTPANFNNYLNGQPRLTPEQAARWTTRAEQWSHIICVLDHLDMKKGSLIRAVRHIWAFHAEGHSQVLRLDASAERETEARVRRAEDELFSGFAINYAIRWFQEPGFGKTFVDLIFEELGREPKTFLPDDLKRIHEETPPEQLMSVLADLPLRVEPRSRRRAVSPELRKFAQDLYIKHHGDPRLPENDGMYDPFAVAEGPEDIL